VGLSVYPLIVARQRLGKHVLFQTLFSMLFMSYKRKLGDYFFTEILVIIILLSLPSTSLSLSVLHTLHTITMIPPAYHVYRILVAMIAPLPPRQFMHPLCWYYRFQKIRSCEFVVACVCITSVWNFVKLRPVALKLKLADIRTDGRSDRGADMAIPVRVLFLHPVHNKANIRSWKYNFQQCKK
jgi:hypothetical protein